MKRYLIAAIAAAVLMAGVATGETVSDLLQKAIYAEETAGDLDGAIKLYRQVLATSTETRALAAQAQFRLGACLLRKGDQSGAKQAFESLIKDYPEQKELVAKAREAMPPALQLLPAPWREGEALEYRLKLPAGMVLGTQVFTLDRGPGETLITETKNYLMGMQWATRVEMERESMRPKSGIYSHPHLGDFRTVYGPKQAVIDQQGKPAKTVELDEPAFDNEEVVQVLRRLPLSAGAKIPVRVLSPPAGAALTISAQVQAIEEVSVPAGKFRAFKVELIPVKQYFWIAQDAPRYVVKFEAQAVVAELVAARRTDLLEPVSFSDAKFGVTVTAPSQWVVQPIEVAGKPEQNLCLLDPEVQGQATIWEGQYSIAAAEIESRLRKDAEEKVPSRKQGLVGYTVRPESWQTRKIGGRPAISFIADYKDKDKPMVEYLTYVRSENVSTQFMVRVAASDFEAFRRRVEPILESMRLR